MDKIQACLASNMKRYRKQLHFSQEKLAEEAKASANYIAMIENGRYFPSLPMLRQIANALYVDCLDLFDKGELKIKEYEDIITHICDAMNYNYAIKSFEDFSAFGYYFPEIYNHPELYLYKYNCCELLDKLRKKGKKIFFATNSNYSYSHYILEKTIG